MPVRVQITYINMGEYESVQLYLNRVSAIFIKIYNHHILSTSIQFALCCVFPIRKHTYLPKNSCSVMLIQVLLIIATNGK